MKTIRYLLVLAALAAAACSKTERRATGTTDDFLVKSSTLMREVKRRGGIEGCAMVSVRRNGRYIDINVQKLANENLPDWPLQKGDELFFAAHIIACMTPAQHAQARQAIDDYVTHRPLADRAKIDCRCMATQSELVIH